MRSAGITTKFRPQPLDCGHVHKNSGIRGAGEIHLRVKRRGERILKELAAYTLKINPFQERGESQALGTFFRKLHGAGSIAGIEIASRADTSNFRCGAT